jgi:hypothetical protein
MPHFPPNTHIDPIFMGIGISVFLLIAALVFHHKRVLRWKKKQALSNMSVDNVETIAFAIACQIRRCKTAEDFYKAVYAIGQYEWQFAENENAKREAKVLKELLDMKASEVYGTETIFS